MILHSLTPFGRHQPHGLHAALWIGILLSLLLTATPLPAQTAAPIAWHRDLYNPSPRPDDVLLPLPCGGAMAFRWVQAEGRAPAGIAPGLSPLFRLVGPFRHEGRHDLLVGKYEVSRLQYATLPALTGGPCPRVDAAGRQVQGGIGWYDALGFAARWSRWLAQQAESFPDCARAVTLCIPRSAGRPALLRLPTDAEWEYVARGGLAVTPGEFGQPLYPMADGLEHHAWYDRNSDQQLMPIGLRSANPLGLHDLYGNVEEFTLGLYRHPAYPGQLGAAVIRGGSVHTGRGGIDVGGRNESPLYGRGVANRAPDNGLRLIADETALPNGTLARVAPLAAPSAAGAGSSTGVPSATLTDAGSSWTGVFIRVLLIALVLPALVLVLGFSEFIVAKQTLVKTYPVAVSIALSLTLTVATAAAIYFIDRSWASLLPDLGNRFQVFTAVFLVLLSTVVLAISLAECWSTVAENIDPRPKKPAGFPVSRKFHRMFVIIVIAGLSLLIVFFPFNASWFLRIPLGLALLLLFSVYNDNTGLF